LQYPINYIALTGINEEHQGVYNMISTKKSARNNLSLVLILALICLMTAAIIPGVMGAALPVDLGMAGNFSILTKSGISTTGTSSIVGDIGVSPIDRTAITGFGLVMDPSNQFSTSSLVTGKVYAADYAVPTPTYVGTAVGDMETAYTTAAGRATTNVENLHAGNLGGKTLGPGVYKYTSDAVLIPTSTILTLDLTAPGDGGSVWIFQVAKDLTMEDGSQMLLANGANASNIYWQIGGEPGVTMNAGTHAEGNLLTLKLIEMKSGASLRGRALAQTAVTLIANTVTIPTDSTVAPVTDFTGTPLTGTVPLTVQFTDQSTNTPTAWNWSFGDATYSTSKNPSHTYSTVGTYTVNLTATNSAGSNTKKIVDYIVVSSVPPVPPAPVALFTGTPISGIVPLTVRFTDLSTNSPTSWLWRFGNDASGLQNPTYTYSAAGNYTVILTVNNAGGLGTLTRTNYISVYEIPVTPPVASFTGSPTSGPAPLSVWFNSTSTNAPTSRAWNFGDGSTVNLSVQNLTHVYLIPGTYTVNLTATNAGGSNTSTRIDYINVTGTPVSHPVASFAADPASGSAPLLVSFTDTSSFVSPLVSWAWNFGDGGTSTVQNPEHIYTSVGMYNVQLTVTDQTGLTNTTTETNAINAYSSVPVASFTYSPSTGPAPLSVTFTGTSSFNESIVSRLWQFGDGNSATGVNPVHTYTTAGSYNVTYNVTDQNGAFSLSTHNNAITVTSSPPGSVDLGLAGNYAILSKSGISTTGSTSVTGNMGVSPITATGITGFALSMDPSNQYSTSSLVVGRVYAADYEPPTPATLTTSISNMETAYVDAAGRAPDATELYAGNLGGKTLAPGVYKWSTGVLIPTSTTLTLDAQGNENAVWIFEVAQDLTMDSGSQIVLANGAKPENIYWQIGGGTGVTIEAGAHAKGNILALKAITMKDGATLDGRALAQTAVSLIGNTVTIPTSTATTSTVGVYRDGVYYLASANLAGGGNVNAFSFGTTNDKPVVVDNKVGVFRNGMFYLATANLAGGGNVNAFSFGTTNDVPIVVDNKVGVFRNGMFYLASANQNGGGTVNAFSFGTTNDIPVVVDNKVGVFRNGMFYLASANQNGGGTVNAFSFGTTNDVPVVWHHDSIDTVGVFRNGMFYLASANQNGGGTVNAFSFGTINDKPVTGTWA
jgi:PKD repeat protein